MSWIWKRDRNKSGEYREEAAMEAAELMSLENQPGYRQETAVRVTESGTVAANTPSTAVPSLILLDPYDKYKPATQAIVVREDPIARYCVHRIAEIVYDDGFRLVKKGTDEEHAYNAPIQDELIRMNGKQMLIRWLAAEREFGWSWLDVIEAKRSADYREDDSNNELQPKIAKIDVYTPLFTTVTAWAEDGNPTDLKVAITRPDGTKSDIPISAKDCILMRTRPYGDRSFRGLSILTDIWDALTYIRQVLFSMGWYSIKVGIGVFYVKIRGAVTSEKVAAAKAVLTGLSTKRGIIYSDLVVDEFGFIQAQAGATNFTGYIDTLFTQVSAGTGIPAAVFAGLSDNSLGGADVSVDLQVSVINTEQRKQEYYLRELFFRMGFEDQDYDFQWPTRYATNEEQESKILMNNTQADVVALDYMTVNEIRKRKGLEPIAGGEELRDNTKMDYTFQTADEKDQTQNEEGTQI